MKQTVDKPLCLVGMSGVGKSHWARRLAEDHGFVHHDCDAAIAARLSELVTPAAGESPVLALGRWMGEPWTAGYGAREKRYLELEAEVTQAALDASGGGAHVLDTTGSVVYLKEPLLSSLRSQTRIVYLSSPPATHRAMLARYLEEPKPVVWGEAFRPRPGETPEDALPRCYERLLRWRDERYARLAHAVLDAHVLGEDGAEVILAATA